MTGFHEEFDHDEPAPFVQRRGFAVEAPLLWRGIALGLLSLILGRMAFGSVRTSVFLLPLSLVFAGAATLAAWASAIQLTGGARHDDHPWI